MSSEQSHPTRVLSLWSTRSQVYRVLGTSSTLSSTLELDTMATKYRSRPVVIEAVHFDGTQKSALQIRKWPAESKCTIEFVSLSPLLYYLRIPTLEGQMTGSPGDYIIKGTQGEFYPCKPKVFTAKYDSVPDDLTSLPSPTPIPSEK